MKTIPISGVIGYDISANDIRDQLDAAKGDAVKCEISSPGGLAFAGIEIYNVLKNYKGEISTHLMGLAGSAATYVAMAAPAERRTAEANAVFAIHNAQGGACGDQNDLRKTADILDALSGILAKAYADATGKTVADCRALMDKTTFYFGNEIKDAGFVSEVVGEQTTDKETACSLALAEITACDETVKKLSDSSSIAQIAAMLGDIFTNKTGVAGETASASTGGAKISGGQKMTLDEFKAANPGVLEAHDKEISAAAHAEGARAEAARRDGISAFLGKTPEGDRAVAEAIASGKSVEAAMPALVAASIPSKPVNDNAPPINAKTPDTVAGTDGLTEDDHKAMTAFNLTPDQLKKYGNKEAD